MCCRCFCDAECLVKSGVGANGQQKGVQMSEVEKLHLHHIEWESLEWASEDLLISTITNNHISSLQTPNSSARAAPNYHVPEASLPSTSTHKETFNDDMLPLMESSDNEKHQFFLQITGETAIESPDTTSRSLRTSIKKSPCVLIISHTPVLFYSCPVLQATHETICKIHVVLKGIRSHTTGITALKLNTIQSLDNLEVHWTELSSLLADDQPYEYSTVQHYSIIIQISSYFKLFSLSTGGC